MDRVWKPNVTVAALIERDGHYLLVEEETDDGIRFNQPAGHLDEGESLIAACSREALEETAWHFTPSSVVGVYQWQRPKKVNEGDITYLRFAFAGTLGEHVPGRVLDEGILRAVWMSPEEIQATVARHRSPLVWQCVADHIAGQRYPLALIRHYA